MEQNQMEIVLIQRLFKQQLMSAAKVVGESASLRWSLSYRNNNFELYNKNNSNCKNCLCASLKTSNIAI